MSKRYTFRKRKLTFWQKYFLQLPPIVAVEVPRLLPNGEPNPEWDKASHEEVLFTYPNCFKIEIVK